MLNPQFPPPPGFNDSQPTHERCTCGGTLNLYFRDRVIGQNAVVRGDLNGLYRMELVSFAPTGTLTIETFDYTDDWQVECDECGDEIYANFA